MNEQKYIVAAESEYNLRYVYKSNGNMVILNEFTRRGVAISQKYKQVFCLVHNERNSKHIKNILLTLKTILNYVPE